MTDRGQRYLIAANNCEAEGCLERGQLTADGHRYCSTHGGERGYCPSCGHQSNQQEIERYGMCRKCFKTTRFR